MKRWGYYARMIKTKGYAALSSTTPLQPFEFERRNPKADDVVIEIAYSGICHSDIHTARGEWGPTAYPCVPGHEIVGKVIAVGKKVRRFRVGDLAGVGCFVDSCGKCESCKSHEQQFCSKGTVFTYNSTELDKKTPTLGGYASHIVVKDKYALKIKKGLPLDRVAPLLCAGITTYSPLKRAKIKKGHKVAVVGLGGLGHMGVKLAKSMGAEVTVFSTSANKELDAKRLGAKHFIISKDPKNFEAVAGRLVEIPVCYEGDFAPDLERVVAWSGMTVSEIIAHHSGPEYRVYLIGFLPGFAYMGAVDERLAAPRLARPRERVPAGSVGIAGVQTGIYPLESPGGWNLIGRTPLLMFDGQHTAPTLLQPGDRVRFYAVSLEQFYQIQSGA